jgi:hypothetical protein
VGKVTGFENDRVEVAEARHDIATMRSKAVELEDRLLTSLARQLTELSVALSAIKDIGGLLHELQTLRGRDGK